MAAAPRGRAGRLGTRGGSSPAACLRLRCVSAPGSTSEHLVQYLISENDWDEALTVARRTQGAPRAAAACAPARSPHVDPVSIVPSTAEGGLRSPDPDRRLRSTGPVAALHRNRCATGDPETAIATLGSRVRSKRAGRRSVRFPERPAARMLAVPEFRVVAPACLFGVGAPAASAASRLATSPGSPATAARRLRRTVFRGRTRRQLDARRPTPTRRDLLRAGVDGIDPTELACPCLSCLCALARKEANAAEDVAAAPVFVRAPARKEFDTRGFTLHDSRGRGRGTSRRRDDDTTAGASGRPAKVSAGRHAARSAERRRLQDRAAKKPERRGDESGPNAGR
jgi:hypothetical protein